MTALSGYLIRDASRRSILGTLDSKAPLSSKFKHAANFHFRRPRPGELTVKQTVDLDRHRFADGQNIRYVRSATVKNQRGKLLIAAARVRAEVAARHRG
jgi:hypothetical protein